MLVFFSKNKNKVLTRKYVEKCATVPVRLAFPSHCTKRGPKHTTNIQNVVYSFNIITQILMISRPVREKKNKSISGGNTVVMVLISLKE